MQDRNEFRHEYVVDVPVPGQPDAGSAGRMTVQDPRIMTSDWNPPEQGEVITLKIHADGRVVFDKSDPRRNRRRFARLRKKGLA